MLKVESLRISITDRCNFRCIYCMPLYGIDFLNKDEILTYEEILMVVKVMMKLGVNKFRITGGEPLVRKDITKLIRMISALDVQDLSLTTNGYLLGINENLAYELKEAGLKRINISLDTVDPFKFYQINRPQNLLKVKNNNYSFHKNYVNIVIKGIKNCLKAGFKNIKINTVLLKVLTVKDILDLINFAIENGLILRFIEFMDTTPLFDINLYVSYKEVLNDLQRYVKIEEYRDSKMGEGPAKYYKLTVNNDSCFIGFIYNTLDNCKECNRIRLTANGYIKICIYQEDGYYIRHILKSNKDSFQKELELENFIKDILLIKETGMINYSIFNKQRNYMFKLGG